MDCVFCSIIQRKIPSHIFWEDENHMAFLSIYPNTLGTSVVVTKTHYDSYAFDLSDEILSSLILASKKVAKILDSKLDNVGRTGLVFEGFGVNHIHAKLFPLHGTGDLKKWKPIHSNINKYFDTYEGYISSHDYKEADPAELESLAKKLRGE